MRAVYDTVTMLQALANPAGPSGECWSLAVRGEVEILTSSDTLAELQDVFSRPKLAKKLEIEPEAAADMVVEVEMFSTFINAVPQLFSYPRDPKDEPFLNLAIAAVSCLSRNWKNASVGLV